MDDHGYAPTNMTQAEYNRQIEDTPYVRDPIDYESAQMASQRIAASGAKTARVTHMSRRAK